MIDARGLSCPQPVLLVQREIKKNAPPLVTVLVDDQCAVGNITRFAASQGYKVRVKEKDEEYTLELTR